MIVFHHFAIHGGFAWGNANITPNYLWYNFILMGGKLGVNVFVLISGYYLIESKSGISLQKIFKFVFQILFFSLLFFAVFSLLGYGDLSIKSIIKVCFPITFSAWWFASAYFVLYLLHPFLNKLLHSLSKAAYQKLIVLLVAMWSVIPTLWAIIPTLTTTSFQSNSLLWFITVYAIAGYIRLYGLSSKFTPKHYCIFGLIITALTYSSTIFYTLLTGRWESFSSYITCLYGQEKIPVLLMAVCLFMIFATLKMKYHKWINVLACASFGVYLIHDNNFIRSFLWSTLFKNSQYQYSLILIPYSIVVCTAVYIACTLIELLRQQIVEKPFMLFVNRYCDKLISPIRRLIDKLNRFVFGKEESD